MSEQNIIVCVSGGRDYTDAAKKAKKFGWPACGPLRNEEMALGKPHVWVLFPGARGTASAREQAEKCGAKLIEVGYD